MSAVDEAVAAHRRLYPDLWAKADRIAEIIEPDVWDDWYDSTEPDATPRPPTTRVLYLRSRARCRAWDVLKELEIAPATTDWAAVFAELCAPPQGDSE